MIPTYHCAGYLRHALRSVLAQDPGPDVMQIEVVDDHSTADDPEAVVEEVGAGRVGFYRRPENGGHVRTFNTCLQRARGELVHLLHGDDYVLPGFYERLRVGFAGVPDLGMAFTRHLYVEGEEGHEVPSLLERPEPGVMEDWTRAIAAGQRLAPPSVAVRRAVYEHLGGFDRRLTCAGEDWEMWVRIAVHYPVWFEPEPLAAYRVKRPGALTDDAGRTGRLARDMRRATEIIEGYLPDHLPQAEARTLTRRARTTYAGWGLEAVEQMLEAGRWGAAAAQAVESLRCSPSLRTLRGVGRLVRRVARSKNTLEVTDG
jgi:hypothetical protein